MSQDYSIWDPQGGGGGMDTKKLQLLLQKDNSQMLPNSVSDSPCFVVEAFHTRPLKIIPDPYREATDTV